MVAMHGHLHKRDQNVMECSSPNDERSMMATADCDAQQGEKSTAKRNFGLLPHPPLTHCAQILPQNCPLSCPTSLQTCPPLVQSRDVLASKFGVWCFRCELGDRVRCELEREREVIEGSLVEFIREDGRRDGEFVSGIFVRVGESDWSWVVYWSDIGVDVDCLYSSEEIGRMVKDGSVRVVVR